jgi:hypothetical protein
MSELDIKSNPKEHITAFPEGDFLCICRNTPHNSGFYPINDENDVVAPTPEDWTTNEYVCAECGRVIDWDSLEVVRHIDPDRLRLFY